MPLELSTISQQVERMVLLATGEERREYLREARRLLREAEAGQLRAKLRERQERIPWLVAIPVSGLSGAFAAPPLPADFSVAAADGSSIPPDRHSPLRYYVLNTGRAVLTYGRMPHAVLDSSGQLYFEEADLYVSPGRRRIPIEGRRLGLKMGLAELRALLEAARETDGATVALRDGSLILWDLQSEEEEVQRQFLAEFRACLDGFRAANLPLASYVSYPGSHDVVNALRVWLCPESPIDCEGCSLADDRKALCQALAQIWDREVFAFLGEGQRSDIFESTSAILEQYGEHRIQFFYLNVGQEVARIEAPQWVMRDREMLARLHVLIYDQCRRGQGYPAALTEAHEQAVITVTERQLVEEMVEQALATRGVVYLRSAKDRSKRSRGV